MSSFQEMHERMYQLRDHEMRKDVCAMKCVHCGCDLHFNKCPECGCEKTGPKTGQVLGADGRYRDPPMDRAAELEKLLASLKRRTMEGRDILIPMPHPYLGFLWLPRSEQLLNLRWIASAKLCHPKPGAEGDPYVWVRFSDGYSTTFSADDWPILQAALGKPQ